MVEYHAETQMENPQDIKLAIHELEESSSGPGSLTLAFLIGLIVVSVFLFLTSPGELAPDRGEKVVTSVNTWVSAAVTFLIAFALSYLGLTLILPRRNGAKWKAAVAKAEKILSSSKRG
jgi:hypothetical protein